MPTSNNYDQLKQLIRNNPTFNSTQLVNEAKNLGFSYRRTDMLSDIREIKGKVEPTHISRQKATPTKYKGSLKPIPIEVIKEEAKLGRGLTKKEYSFETSKFGHISRELERRLGLNELDALERARKIVQSGKGVRIKKKLDKIDKEILIQFNTP